MNPIFVAGHWKMRRKLRILIGPTGWVSVVSTVRQGIAPQWQFGFLCRHRNVRTCRTIYNCSIRGLSGSMPWLTQWRLQTASMNIQCCGDAYRSLHDIDCSHYRKTFHSSCRISNDVLLTLISCSGCHGWATSTTTAIMKLLVQHTSGQYFLWSCWMGSRALYRWLIVSNCRACLFHVLWTVRIDGSAQHLPNHFSDRNDESRAGQFCPDIRVPYSLCLTEAGHLGIRYCTGRTGSDHSDQSFLTTLTEVDLRPLN